MHVMKEVVSCALPWRAIAFLVVGVGICLLLPQAASAAPPFEANLIERLAALEEQLSAQQSTIEDQAAQIAALTAALEAEAASREQGDADLSGEIASHTHDWSSLDLTPFTRELFDLEDPEGGYNVIITGANLHLRNGEGQTSCMNYLGNLVIGYNEVAETRWDAASETWVPWSEADRSGSHNIVLGSENTYTHFGGLVAGTGNRICAPMASVSGGYANTAGAPYASVVGGHQNFASGERSSVLGGMTNTASGTGASVSGGVDNTASSDWCSVSGGASNTASAWASCVSGGGGRVASGSCDWVAGALWQDW